MNILAIATILPIPGVIRYNDFVYQIYRHYRDMYEADSITMIKPVKIDLNPIKTLKGKTQLGQLNKKYRWDVEGFQVEIFPFLSSWSRRNLHAILTRSIFWLHKKRIRSLLEAHQIQVIHAHYIFSDGMLAYLINRSFGIPYVITTHHERYYFDHSYSREMALRILGNASFVLPLNYTNAQYFKSLGIQNVEVSPLGFNTAFLKNQKPKGKGPVRIFTASVLIKLKNIDQVIRAVASLITSYDITYSIIGKGEEKENLEKLVKSLGLDDIVNFIDHVPHEEMPDLMHDHDIFIMPSYFETFGRVFFECMAMGIPIICAQNSGIHGIFKEKEEGLSVDHQSVENIAEGLSYLLSDPEERRRIGRNGQKLASKYTWDRVANDLHEKYIHCLKKRD